MYLKQTQSAWYNGWLQLVFYTKRNALDKMDFLKYSRGIITVP